MAQALRCCCSRASAIDTLDPETSAGVLCYKKFSTVKNEMGILCGNISESFAYGQMTSAWTGPGDFRGFGSVTVFRH